MNQLFRNALLERLSTDAGRTALASPSDDLQFDEYAAVAECLCTAPMLLRTATEGVTERYALGTRGTIVLGLISRGIHYPAEISLVLDVGRSLISHEITRLMNAGLIERHIQQNDRRRSRLTLTEAGKCANRAVRGDMVQIVKASLSSFTNSDVRALARMLETMRRDARRRV